MCFSSHYWNRGTAQRKDRDAVFGSQEAISMSLGTTWEDRVGLEILQGGFSSVVVCCFLWNLKDWRFLHYCFQETQNLEKSHCYQKFYFSISLKDPKPIWKKNSVFVTFGVAWYLNSGSSIACSVKDTWASSLLNLGKWDQVLWHCKSSYGLGYPCSPLEHLGSGCAFGSDPAPWEVADDD